MHEGAKVLDFYARFNVNLDAMNNGDLFELPNIERRGDRWHCGGCNVAGYAVSDFAAHARAHVDISQFAFLGWKCRCGRTCTSRQRYAAHRNICNGERLGRSYIVVD